MAFMKTISAVGGQPKSHEVWRTFAEKYGPIYKLKMPQFPPMVCTLNPEDIALIYRASVDTPFREGFGSLKKIRSEAPNNYFNKKSGLLPENGDEWWRLRSRVQGPLLKPRNVAMYLPKVDSTALKFMDRIDVLQEQHGGRVPDDFLQELYKWAFESVGLVAMDREFGCLDPDLCEDSKPMQMIHHIHKMIDVMDEIELGLPIWKLYKTATYRQLEAAHNAFLEIADESIQEACAKLAAAKARGDPNLSLTVMETLVNTEGLSQSDVATMILDMLFAGVDSTSNTVAFTLYLLAKNPKSQKKLQEEIDRVLGDSAELLPEHIVEMNYLNYVVKESLRLYPISIGNARVLPQDAVLSGYSVPAGCMVIGLNMLICTDDEHFSRSKEFLPERWDRARPLGDIHPFASLPFSHGKRMCVGKRIAEQEIYAFLIRAMQKYDVTFELEQEMDIVTHFLLKPEVPLAFKFHPRK